jgi:uncharacterized membrane protein
MNNTGSLLAAMTAGASLSYLFDIDRGARRRARARDTVTHAAIATRRAISTTTRDATHRTYGTAASAASLLRRGSVDDCVLIERVRAKLGRHVSHPHAIEVTAKDGVATLRGPILSAEGPGLIRAVRHVRGVRSIVDELEWHEDPGNTPALQGGAAPRGEHLDLLQNDWSPATRCLAATGATALIATGAARRDLAGTLLALAGIGLAARAATNVPLAELAGFGVNARGVQLQKTITINAPVGEVYAFWAWYENFPRFMSRVLDVSMDIDGRRSHWRVAGPAGLAVEFAAEVTHAVANQMIAWRTLPGTIVAHSGVVQFERVADGRTRVHVRMAYVPPAGWLGHGVASAFGVDPKHSMDADLARMKTLIETGHAPHDAAVRTVGASTRRVTQSTQQ